MKIIDKESMKKWILADLGEPIIKVELADIHLEQVIEKALKKFHRYAAGSGSIYEYGVFGLVPGKQEYNLRSIGDAVASVMTTGEDVPTGVDLETINQALESSGWENSKINIDGVIEVATIATAGAASGGDTIHGGIGSGLNGMFSGMHGWFYNGGAQGLGLNPGYDQQTTGPFNGTGPNNPFGNSAYHAGFNGGEGAEGMTGLSQSMADGGLTKFLPLANYVRMMQYLADIERIFGEKIMAIWRPDAGILRIYETPKTETYAIMKYYRREEAIYLYNNPLFQDLVVAMAGVQWGSNISKYSNTMAGGGSINGDAIKSQYEAELEKAIAAIKSESWYPLLRKG